MIRTYGKLWLDSDHWHLEAEPHVAMWAKRIFPKIGAGAQGVLKLRHSEAVCRDLEWFLQRFTLDVRNLDELTASSRKHQDHILTLNAIVGESYQPRQFEMALPPRRYQSQAVELYLANKFLLLGDDVGLGKTCTAIASLTDPRTLPACVVTLAHLPKQWKREIEKFSPQLSAHVIKKGTPYELPKVDGRAPDVLIINYHKLAKWATVLGNFCNSVIYDECQELRRNESVKYTSAKHLSSAVDFQLGLSATPIYNYGGEIFNVINAMRSGALGTRSEFLTEWCKGYAGKESLKEPIAFGSYLREQHLFLRRTRVEVGRELPPLQKIIQHVDSDARELAKVEGAARELAKIILSRTPRERFEVMRAAGEFDNLMRQATGIAKAPYVAEFVRMLVESGERVLLYGWHRAVYEIWLSKLKDLNPAMYTGSESSTKKDSEIERFKSGQTNVLIMSLRAGAGVDGLQFCCRTVVNGELDWSPAVLDQNIGRVARDGQPDPVTAYFLVADDGVDPIMSETLGLKREQLEGIRDLGGGGVERLERDADGLRKLAARYLGKEQA